MSNELSPADAVRAFKERMVISQQEQDRLHAKAMQHISIFHEGFYEHIDAEPIYVKSKRQLREETRSRGLISDYAEG